MRDTVILSAADAATTLLPYPYAHISIQDPGAPEWPLSVDPNRVATLRVFFWDQRTTGNKDLPKGWQMGNIAPFVIAYADQVEGFVVNCAAGISRSSGVAAAIAESFGTDASYCYAMPRNPNPVVRAFVEHHLGWLRARGDEQ